MFSYLGHSMRHIDNVCLCLHVHLCLCAGVLCAQRDTDKHAASWQVVIQAGAGASVNTGSAAQIETEGNEDLYVRPLPSRWRLQWPWGLAQVAPPPYYHHHHQRSVEPLKYCCLIRSCCSRLHRLTAELDAASRCR